MEGIPNEAWTCMQGRTEQELCNLMKNVWKGEGIPNDFKEGLLTLLYTKGDNEKVRYY